MMAGRTAEREGMARVAAGQLVERRERALRRPIGRFPCSRRDRRSRIIAVGAEIGVDAPETQRSAAPDRKGVADRIPVAARGDPTSEERRVGKAGFTSGRYPWSP